MHRVKYHKRARKALRRIPANRAAAIIAAVDRIAHLEDPASDPNVKMMTADWSGSWRLRIGEYRVVFELHETDEGENILLIFVTHIGTRGDIYG